MRQGLSQRHQVCAPLWSRQQQKQPPRPTPQFCDSTGMVVSETDRWYPLSSTHCQVRVDCTSVSSPRRIPCVGHAVSPSAAPRSQCRVCWRPPSPPHRQHVCGDSPRSRSRHRRVCAPRPVRRKPGQARPSLGWPAAHTRHNTAHTHTSAPWNNSQAWTKPPSRRTTESAYSRVSWTRLAEFATCSVESKWRAHGAEIVTPAYQPTSHEGNDQTTVQPTLASRRASSL